MASEFNARATIDLDVKGLERLNSLQKEIDQTRDKLKAASKEGGKTEDVVRLRTEVKKLENQYKDVERAMTGAAKSGQSFTQKMSAGINEQIKSTALQVVSITALIRGVQSLARHQLELENGTGSLTSAMDDLTKSGDGLLDILTGSGSMEAGVKAVSKAVDIARVGMAAWAGLWGGLGSMSAGGSFAEGFKTSTDDIANQAKLNAEKREQLRLEKETAAAKKEILSITQSLLDPQEQINLKYDQMVIKLISAGEYTDEWAERIRKMRTEELNKSDEKYQDMVNKAKELVRLQDEMNKKANAIERESQRGDLGAGGWGANGGITDFSPAALKAAAGTAWAEGLMKSGKKLAEQNEKTRKSEQELGEERLKQATAAVELYQNITAAITAISGGNYSQGVGSLVTQGAAMAGVPGAGIIGAGVSSGIDVVSGLTSGRGPQRDQAIGAAVGFAVAGPVGMEIGKSFSKVFGGKGAHVRIMNPEEIATNIRNAIIGESTSIGGASVSDASIASFSGINPNDKAAIEEYRQSQTEVADSIGLTIDRSMELRTAMEQGSRAAEARRVAEEDWTDATEDFVHTMGEENLGALIQTGAAALDEYMAGVEKSIEIYQQGVAALADFNSKTDRVIADITGNTDEWLAVERDHAMSRIAFAESATDAIQAGNDALNILAEQYSRNVATATKHIEDETKKMLETLSGEFEWFSGILSGLLDAQSEKAKWLAAQEEKRFELSRMRTSITGRYEEQNAEELYGSLLGEFGSLRGGADLTNERDVNRLLGVLGEAQGTIGTARSQSLIGGDEAIRRIDEIEKLYDEIYGAQISAAGRRESTLSQSLVDSTFGQAMGLSMGEGGIMLNGQQVSAQELQTRAQTFFQEAQLDIQTAQDEKLGRILDFLAGIYSEQVQSVKDAVNETAGVKLDEMNAMIGEAVDILVSTFADTDPELVKKINRWYDRELGQTKPGLGASM